MSACYNIFNLSLQICYEMKRVEISLLNLSVGNNCRRIIPSTPTKELKTLSLPIKYNFIGSFIFPTV
jgi:hypothetical protein